MGIPQIPPSHHFNSFHSTQHSTTHHLPPVQHHQDALHLHCHRSLRCRRRQRPGRQHPFTNHIRRWQPSLRRCFCCQQPGQRAYLGRRWCPLQRCVGCLEHPLRDHLWRW